MIRRPVLAGVAAVCASLAAAAGPVVPPAGAGGMGASGVPSCGPGALTASLEVTGEGSTSTSLAGSIVFHDTSARACTLQGVPRVVMVTAGGQAVHLFEEAVGATGAASVRLVPRSSGDGGTLAAASITWSDLTCGVGSFTVSVRFAGWSTPLRASDGLGAGSSTAPCTLSKDQTVYVGPVAVTGRWPQRRRR
jgi:hypothetical protein